MKKTVIKRRKRVPAITSANRTSASLADSSSPAPPTFQPGTVPTTTSPPSRDGHQGDMFGLRSNQHTQHQSPSRPLSSLNPAHPPLAHSYHDSGPRSSAVPLPMAGGIGGEKKRPWYIEEGRDEAERRMREREKSDWEREVKDRESVSSLPSLPSPTKHLQHVPFCSYLLSPILQSFHATTPSEPLPAPCDPYMAFPLSFTIVSPSSIVLCLSV